MRHNNMNRTRLLFLTLVLEYGHRADPSSVALTLNLPAGPFPIARLLELEQS